MKTQDKSFGWIINQAYMRDGKTEYAGAALVLACLLHVKKERTAEQEEELKTIMNVYSTGQHKKRGKKK